MPPISNASKLIIGIIAGLFGVLAAMLSSEVDKDVLYWIRTRILHEKRGRPPKGKSPVIWFLLIFSVIVAVVGTAVVTAAPSPASLPPPHPY